MAGGLQMSDKKLSIAILGSTGMLGNAVYKYFSESGKYTVHSSYRNEALKRDSNSFYFDATKSHFNDIPKCDYIINCIGIIKPFMDNNVIESIFINSVFPKILSSQSAEAGMRMIHITTDCVFSGKDGNYSEDSKHDAPDSYGQSKSAGEPDDCMVIRTSIIGEEIHKNASLLEWVKKNKGKEISGYTNHLWNGVTTKHYAELCSKIIDDNLYEVGLFHVHSNSVNKYELLKLINKRFDLGITINPTEAIPIDRTLSSVKELNTKLSVKTIQQQVEEL
jgi:dTDP-4-dehydrorhamnose reductase